LNSRITNAGTIEAISYGTTARGILMDLGYGLSGTYTFGTSINNEGTISASVSHSGGALDATAIFVEGELNDDISNTGSISGEATLTGGVGSAGATGVNVAVMQNQNGISNGADGSISATARVEGTATGNAQAVGIALGTLSSTYAGVPSLDNAGSISALAELGDLTYSPDGHAYATGIRVQAAAGAAELTIDREVDAELATVSATAINLANGDARAIGIEFADSDVAESHNSSLLIGDQGQVEATATVSGSGVARATGLSLDLTYQSTFTNAGTISAQASGISQAMAKGVTLMDLYSAGTFEIAEGGSVSVNAAAVDGSVVNLSATAIYIGNLNDSGASFTNHGEITATVTRLSEGDQTLSAFAVRVDDTNNSGLFTNSTTGVLNGNVWLGQRNGGSIINMANDGQWHLAANHGGFNDFESADYNHNGNAAYISGDFTQNGTLNLHVSSLDEYAQVYVGGEIDMGDDAEAPFVLVFDDPSAFLDSLGEETVKLDDLMYAKGGFVDGLPTGEVQSNLNTLLWELSYSQDHTDDLDVLIALASVEEVVDEMIDYSGAGAYAGAGGLVDWLIDNYEEMSEALQQRVDDILLIQSPEELIAALAGLSPAYSTEISRLMQSSADAASRIIHSRLGLVLGLAGGDQGDSANGLWAKPFYVNADQDRTGGNHAFGYDANMTGVMLGTDTLLNDRWRLGVAFAYTDTDLDGKGVLSNDELNTDAYQVSLYVQGEPWQQGTYTEMVLSYGWADNEVRRDVQDENSVLRAEADFDSGFARGQVNLGHVFELNDCWSLVPELDVTYLWMEQDAYTEQGAGDLSLRVDSLDDDVLTLGFDLGTAYDVAMGGQGLMLSAYAGVAYDAIEADADLSASLVGAGPAFLTKNTERDRFAVRAGVGARLGLAMPFDVSVNYDIEARDNHTAQAVSMNLRYEF
jgi:outer membrane autotransporter protein